MADLHIVKVSLEEIGEVEALWCEHCLLPSKLEGTVAVMVNDVLDHIVTFWYCVECEREGWR